MRSLLCLAAAPALALALLCAPAAAQRTGTPPEEPPPTRRAPTALVPPEEPPPPYPPLRGAAADSVREVLYRYMLAVYERDGAAAVPLVTRASRGYYARMRDHAITAPEAEVRAMPLMDRLSILMLRHRVPARELRTLQGDSVFAYSIDHAWVSSEVGRSRPQRFDADVFGEGDRAVMLMSGGNAHFLREDGAWRLDLAPLLEGGAAQLMPPPDSGMTEDEFILMVLRMTTGRRPSPSIWQPAQ